MSRWYNPFPDPAPAVHLRRLWPEARFLGADDLLATGYAADAHRVQPGQIFVALRMPGYDGHDHVGEALARGAAGAIVDTPGEELAGPLVVVPDTGKALASLAHALAGHPARRVEVVGVTGDSGKTATIAFLRSILEAAGQATGVLGPEDWTDGRRWRPRSPLPAHGGTVAELLAAMADESCQNALLELPIESLAAGSAESLDLSAAIVGHLEDDLAPAGNTPGDRTRQAARLVRSLRPEGLLLLDGDSPAHGWLSACRLDATVHTFGLGDGCDIRAEVSTADSQGSRGVFRTPVGAVPFRLGLAGLGAVRAAAAATALALVGGLAPEAIIRGLASVDVIPGRLERLDLGAPFVVLVDRARTGPELARAIRALRETVPGRVHCLLSARADADSPTRARLARVLETQANLVTLSPESRDDPDADAIIDDHLALYRRPGRVRRCFSRMDALAEAMHEARPGDAILLAGRGRERPYLASGPGVEPSDADLARAAWLSLAGNLRRRSA